MKVKINGKEIGQAQAEPVPTRLQRILDFLAPWFVIALGVWACWEWFWLWER